MCRYRRHLGPHNPNPEFLTPLVWGWSPARHLDRSPHLHHQRHHAEFGFLETAAFAQEEHGFRFDGEQEVHGGGGHRRAHTEIEDGDVVGGRSLHRVIATLNRDIEALCKKLDVTDKDGKVTAQGKEVTKVKVNGKEFFGGDVKTATRELNADMVDRIQVIDDYGDQSAFTGIKDGDPTKTLNIQLKKE